MVLPLKTGRGEKIRTSDLRYPKPSRYQAALRPDIGRVARINADGKHLFAVTGPNCSSLINVRIAHY